MNKFYRGMIKADKHKIYKLSLFVFNFNNKYYIDRFFKRTFEQTF